MSKLKFIQIDSFKQEDLTELFGLICKNIIQKSPTEVIAEVKSLTDRESFTSREPSSSDILQVISIYDIAFELKLNYIDSSVKTELVAPEPKSEGLIEDKGNALISKQMDEIKLEVWDKTEKKEDKVKEDEIPDFT
jgi:hypothetical protein